MIKIDDRESEWLFNGFRKENIEYERVRLKIGDIQSGNCIFEHKTENDLIQSFRNGRLKKELWQQEQVTQNSFLIISGNFKSLFFNKYIKLTYEQLLGIIASINARFPKTRIIYTMPIADAINRADNRVLALLCGKIAEKAEDGKVISFEDTDLFKCKLNTGDIRLKMLTCLPMLGKGKATELLKEYGLKGLFEASEEELRKFKGVGKVLARSLKLYFS